MPSIKCTNCGAVLKTQAEIPAGKKVKCPKCSEAFVVQAEVPPEEPKKMPAPVEDDPGDPFKDMDADMPKPKRKGKPAADEDEGITEDEPRPRRKGRRGADEEADGDEKPAKKKSNTTLYIILAVAFFFLTCCVCTPIGVYFGIIVPAAEQAKDVLKKFDEEMKKEMERQNKMKGVGQPPPVVGDKKADAPVIQTKKEKKS
jgi:phage FluMu protein Com